jgi:hypothetical protein
MKKLFTSFLSWGFAVLLSSPLLAQIPSTSPFPVDFFVESNTGFNRQFDYGTMADFGVNLDQTVSGELVWAYDSAGDSLVCTPVEGDLTGKVAFIRRGLCNFSLKIWHAQDAGAVGVVIVNNIPNAEGGGLVNMAGGDSATLVNIPAVFITWDDGEIVRQRMQAGETITATFSIRSFFGELGPYTFGTPKDQIVPMGDIEVQMLNVNTVDPILNAMAQVDIIDPVGEVTTLTSTLAEIAPTAFGTFEFDDYLPDLVGEYTMIFTNSLSEDSLTRNFVITDHTFQMDNGNIPEWPVDSWIANSYAGFVTDGLRYDIGNYYLTGSEGGVATYATFSLGNPDSLYTGDPESDLFTIILFDADPNNDGIGPPGDLADYDPNELIPVAFTSYALTGEETEYELITVEFDEPAELKPDGQYLLMVQYDGTNSALGIPPWYTYAGTEGYPGFSTVVYTSRLFMGGWSGDFHGVVRLHTEGFTPVGTQFQALDEAKVTLMPNPTSDFINVKLELENIADRIEMRMSDFSGRLLERKVFDHVRDGIFTFDTHNLPAGTYFLSVNTPEGFRAKKFVVVK